jgi:virulence-associated protein VagC
VKNTNTDFILELSPPDNGGMVLSIISVSSTRLSDGNLAEPVEVIKSPVDIDERGMSLSRAACGGKPVILKPGETAQFNIWLNANYFDKTMSSADRTDCGWHTGIGCYQPGKYRITVKYMNIEGLSHFGDRYIPADKRFLAEGKRLDKSKPVLIPPEPVGLGSVEVEITSLGKDSLIVPLLKTWDGLARQKESDVFCIDQPERLRTILDDPIFKDRKLAYLKASLELSMIACQVDMGELEKMQTALEKGRLALKPDPLAEVYGLVECRVLKAMGKTGEALKLAEEINSPDTVVLVEDLKHALKEAEEKKQNPQPGK